jgi:hypothetical protein
MGAYSLRRVKQVYEFTASGSRKLLSIPFLRRTKSQVNIEAPVLSTYIKRVQSVPEKLDKQKRLVVMRMS